MADSATYAGNLTATEDVTISNIPAASAPTQTLTHSGFNTQASFSSSTTPAMTKKAYYEKPLVAGAATIDLTTHTGSNGAVQDFTGLKVRAFKFKAKSTNAGDLTVTFGAANPYLLGGTGWKFILKPGAEIQGVFPVAAQAPAAVGGSAKTIDLSGTGTDVLQVALIAG